MKNLVYAGGSYSVVSIVMHTLVKLYKTHGYTSLNIEHLYREWVNNIQLAPKDYPNKYDPIALVCTALDELQFSKLITRKDKFIHFNNFKNITSNRMTSSFIDAIIKGLLMKKNKSMTVSVVPASKNKLNSFFKKMHLTCDDSIDVHLAPIESKAVKADTSKRYLASIIGLQLDDNLVSIKVDSPELIQRAAAINIDVVQETPMYKSIVVATDINEKAQNCLKDNIDTITSKLIESVQYIVLSDEKITNS